MQVVPMADFHFESASNSPYATAPSSPRLFGESFGYYTSAPSSPTRMAAIYNHFNPSSPSSVVPLDWEEKPGDDDSMDFAFEVGGQLDAGLVPITAADELFEEGKIRPLKPPLPRIQRLPSKIRNERSPAASPRSQKSVVNRARAMEETTRGRERTNPLDGSRGSRRAARSLSPLRAGFDLGKSGGVATNPSTTTTTNSTSTTNYAKGGSKKWRLRDLLLFRSASEGRATGDASKDPLMKYTLLSPLSSSLLSKKGGDDSKNASFRSTDSSGSSSSSKKAASAHEKHYTARRAASEEMKKKTFLPYPQGLLGCIGSNPVINGITKRFGSLAHQRS